MSFVHLHLHTEYSLLDGASRPEALAKRAGAILLYRIPRVIVGENRTFLGEEELLRSRGVAVEVVDDAECIAIMTKFIEENPRLWNEDIGE